MESYLPFTTAKSIYQTNHQNADLIGLKLIDEAQ